jgi:hypothetical protein
VAIIDNKIKKSQVKLDLPGDDMENIPVEFREKIENVDTEIKKLLRYVEHLGEIGKIEESEKLMEEIERLRSTKEDLKVVAENPALAAKQMKVCEICGAMQAINDTEVRNQNHLEGKVHTGFALLRKELEQLKKRKDILKLLSNAERKEREKRVKSRSGDRYEEERERRRRKSKKKRKHRERSRSWSKSEKRKKKHKKKHKKRKHRDRSRSRSKDRREH